MHRAIAHKTIAVAALIGLITIPLGAQGRGRGRGGNGVPPGHQPRAGECRVWYDGRPPGQQPPAMDCRNAERIAAREPDARVIYGSDRGRGNGNRNRVRDRDRDRDGRNDRRAERRFPGRDRDRRGGNIERSVAFDNGTRDGYIKGEEDARKNRSSDPVRHSWYRSADRGYNSRYGTKEEYRDAYRAGFQVGYEDGYRGNLNDPDRRRGGLWPF